VSPALAAPAIERDAFHSIRRAAAYRASLLRFAPERKPPGDTSDDLRDPARRVRRLVHELREH